MIRFMTLLVASVVLLLFCLANLQVVELKTVFAEPVRASLAFLLVGSFMGGFFLATMVNLHQTFKSKLRERQRKKQVGGFQPPLLPAPPQIPSRGLDGTWQPGTPGWR
jgi:uncharacterized integral membrane protein